MNKTPRIALIRNRVYPGGIFHVMLEMIRVLNKRGIVPDLVTLRSKVSPEVAAEKYNVDVEFKVREILTDFRIPYEWHIILFNKIIRNYLKKYDLVINHNNTSFLYNRFDSQKLVSYVHFPRKARGLSDMVSTHIPEGEKKKWYHIRRDPFKLASRAYQFDTKVDEQEVFVANSDYTRQTLLDHYDIQPEKVQVLYPPVDVSKKFSPEPRNEQLVVSLGRFSPEKQQLAQLEIAHRLPNLKFKVMGFISDTAYFRECKNYVEQHELNHVELLPNLSYSKVNEILDQAGLFLHAVQNEPFGITTVKAISRSCIPVVPDSGGQIEIVPDSRLRYLNISEAVELIKQIVKKSQKEKQRLRARLFERVQEFDIPNFQKQFDVLLNHLIT